MRTLRTLSLLLLAACSRSTPEVAPSTRNELPARPEVRVDSAYVRPAGPRIVAIGDLHGDLAATRKALRMAGAIDAQDHWSGGKLVVVQTGDVLDRGDDDKAVFDLLQRLRTEASHEGGALIALSGNHEVMNVMQDLRYVSTGGYEGFAGPAARAAAFQPGGPYARQLAQWPVVVKVGSSVFVHGGILREHVAYGFDRINDEVAAYMRGERGLPAIMQSEEAPIWTRRYSTEPGDCAQLAEVLAQLGAKRMVVGHTPQQHGIGSACEGKVWRIDTGMSHFYGGEVQVLQITGETVQPLGDSFPTREQLQGAH